MKNIVSATASAMSRKQTKSEEIFYNLQRRQGVPSTRLKHTDVCIRELMGSGLGDEKGTRYYRNCLIHQAGFGSSGVICLDETSPGDGGGKLPAGGGVQETDDLWIQEFMKRDESEDSDVTRHHVHLQNAMLMVPLGSLRLRLVVVHGKTEASGNRGNGGKTVATATEVARQRAENGAAADDDHGRRRRSTLAADEVSGGRGN